MSTDDAGDAAVRAGHLLGAVVARIQDVLPALDVIVDEVRQAWLDAAGRAWCDHASLVRRALLRDLDAAVAAARSAETLATSLADPTPENAVADGAAHAVAAGARSPSSRTGHTTGPRLGDTDADRTDEEPGMRISTLDDPG